MLVKLGRRTSAVRWEAVIVVVSMIMGLTVAAIPPAQASGAAPTAKDDYFSTPADTALTVTDNTAQAWDSSTYSMMNVNQIQVDSSGTIYASNDYGTKSSI